MAFLIDLIGSSAFVDDDFEVTSAGTIGTSAFLDQFQTMPPVRSGGVVHVFQEIPRSDIVDLAVGLKVQLFARAVGFVSAIVPVVKDGFRPNVIAAGGVEYTF